MGLINKLSNISLTLCFYFGVLLDGTVLNQIQSFLDNLTLYLYRGQLEIEGKKNHLTCVY